MLIEWNHNTHYHEMILNSLPAKRSTALDIGGGISLFASKLSTYFEQVYALDADKASIDFSKTKYKSVKNLKYINSNFLEYNFKHQKFDFITALASVHHMDYKSTLERMFDLLKPGGRLVILGLYKESTLMDYLYTIVAMIPNFVMNKLSLKSQEQSTAVVTTSPGMTLPEIKEISDKVLGSYHFKRLLFWRYLLVFEKQA